MKKTNYLMVMMAIVSVMMLNCKANRDIVAEIEVDTGSFERAKTPMSVRIDVEAGIDLRELNLLEVGFLKKTPVDAQFVWVDDALVVHWQLGELVKPGTRIKYKLIRKKETEQNEQMKVEPVEGVYTLSQGNQHVLSYNAATVYPPEGEDEAYKRSGFIHPLYAPNGAVLTQIQPADHLHHYGVWNPWTKTTFRDEEVDFWNLRKLQGTVRHAGVLQQQEGPVFAALKVMHEHIAWPESTKQVLAMNEINSTRVYEFNENTFMVDFEFQLTPQEPIVLEEYRYGGFVFRGTEEWTNQTSDFFTSEGLNRDQADGRRARWCVVSGTTTQGEASILFMGNPANYNHPEPLRVWPSDGNRGRGDVFINFSPTRNTSWSLQAKETYTLAYRVLVINGTIDAALAEKFWNDYNNPPVVTLK
jgi:hypothetical protein